MRKRTLLGGRMLVVRACNLLLSALLAVFVTFGLSACRAGLPQQQFGAPEAISTKDDEKAIRDAMEKQLKAIEPKEEFHEHLLKRFSCKMANKVKVERDVATLDVKVSNVNLEAAFNAAYEAVGLDEMVSSLGELYREERDPEMYDAMYQELYKAIDASEDVVTTELTLHFTKHDNTWELDEKSAQEFAAAALPGLE
ncbi:MAG: hypothetical protein IKG21_10445 [Atopobiaceae bacterium]|nr:hypothetical protein [Atopobiaceae bacterium]